jgi:hypothetical protein
MGFMRFGGGIGATRRVLCKEHLALEIALADGMRQNNEMSVTHVSGT